MCCACIHLHVNEGGREGGEEIEGERERERGVLIGNQCAFFGIIRASQSKPHTSDVNQNFSVYIYLYIYLSSGIPYIRFFYFNDLQYFNTTINAHAL